MSGTHVGLLSAGLIDDQLRKEKQYWLEKLSGDLFRSSLPLDFPRPATFSARKDEIKVELEPEITNRLAAISSNSEELIFTVLVVALKLCLHRYMGARDIIVGTAIHERYREVACLNKVLTLRDTINEEETVAQLLQDAKQTLSDAYANQKYPFESLLGSLNIAWPEDRAPIFDAVILFDAINNRKNVDHLKSDFLLIFSLKGGALSATVEYRKDLFKRESMHAFISFYKDALRAVVNNPGRKVKDLDLIGEEKRRELIFDFNDNRREYPSFHTLHWHFEQQARSAPDKPALFFGDTRFTYGELNRRANRLARRLRSFGVGPEVVAAIFMHRSTDMVVALLAVLKAGGAYVPLDPAYPRERLSLMIEDTAAPVIITQPQLVGLLPDQSAARVEVYAGDEAVSAYGGEDIDGGATADNLAYVIYTSGSTGRPKGVAIEHRSAVSMIYWAKEVYGQEELSGMLASSSICFDMSVFELFLPLTTGGAVVLVENITEVASLPPHLADSIRFINTVPSSMSYLLEVDGLPRSVRTVNLAGEPLLRPLAEQIYKQPCVERLFNLYGPSEDTTHSTFILMERADAAPPPIGRPIPNSRTYIVDSGLRLTPAGVPGEILIGGEGLARGYLNRPDLTAEKFIPDPFSGQPGARVYRTGDLARYLADRNLEFLGRLDHQVKVRGFRIELGEIESALLEHPRVQKVVVTAREQQPGAKRLVAYATGRQPGSLDRGELRDYLKKRLPEYMVPETIVLLDEFPSTPNGKVDRKALPLPDWTGGESQAGFVPPRTPVEEGVAGIWAEVLGLERVGVKDDFIDLGGHSLLGSQIIVRVRKAFDVEFPLGYMFDNATVAGMAAVISRSNVGQAALSTSGVETQLNGGSRAELLDKIDSLTDDHVEELLERLTRDPESVYEK